MGNFNSPQKTTSTPAMDELDEKIAKMNSYLVDGRTELDRLEGQKKNLNDEIAELQDKGADLKSDVTQLEGKVGTLEAAKKELEEKISSLKNEIVLEGAKLQDAQKQVAVAEEHSKAVLADVEKREKDVADKETTMLVFAKSLDEREKKLDEYAAKMNRFVDGLKKT